VSVDPEHRFVTPSGYEGWKADEKLDWLWQELIEATEYTAGPVPIRPWRRR
jgi:hypothetical protein